MSTDTLHVVTVERGPYLHDLLQGHVPHDIVISRCATEEEVQKTIAFSQQHPTVVLLDVADKELSGFAILELLHAKNRHDLNVIVASHSGEPVDIDHALRLGAEDYIIKEQFTPEELVAKIKRAAHRLTLSRTQTMQDSIEQPGGSAIDITNVSVLIIEDDQFLRDLASRKLKQEGFRVDIAIDGEEGLKKIQEQKPNVVLLDIILPGVDGFDILQRVRANKDTSVRESIVILLSNLGQEADVAKGERLGADDYLIKANFTIDEIIEKIRTALGKKQSSQVH